MGIQAADLLRLSRRFGQFYTGSFGALLERTGLSMAEVSVLLFLANNPDTDTARDVTELRGLAKSQVSQAVESLVGRGLLRREADGSDRRVVHLAVTEAGAPLSAQAQAIQTQCGKALLTGLSEQERRQLEALLVKVIANADALAGRGR